jgi:hypothetical protein
MCREQCKFDPAEGLAFGLPNFSETKELKLNIMNLESISFFLFHPHPNI